MLALAKTFVERGHDVTWLGQPSIESRAVLAGCRFVPFQGVPSYEPRVEIEEQLPAVMALIAFKEAGEQLTREASGARSDLIVVDGNLAGCLAAAEALSKPSAVLLHSMYATFVEIWLVETWPSLAPFINDTREHFGLSACGSWGELLAAHDRLVAVVPEAFEGPIAGIPATMRHWGFLVPSTPLGGASGAFGAAGRANVLVGLSTTYQHQEALLQRILDALGALDVNAIASTSGQVACDTLRRPTNVELHDFVDFQTLLADCDVMITHAGLGTVAMALSRGVPLVCTPLGRDQHLNARRVVECGAGVVVDDGADAEAIAEAVRTVLRDTTYRDAARRVARQSREAGGVLAAVRDLEQLFGS